MWFCTEILRLSWTDYMNDDKVLEKILTKMTFQIRIRKRQM